MRRKNQRKPAIYPDMIDIRAQFRILFPLVFLAAVGGGCIFYIYYRFSGFMMAINSLDDLNPALRTTINSTTKELVGVCFFSLSLLGVSCFVFWVTYSRRIFGPMVPIRRQLDRLTAGNFQEKITLRKNDEFKDIAHQINLLTEKLREQKNENTKNA